MTPPKGSPSGTPPKTPPPSGPPSLTSDEVKIIHEAREKEYENWCEENDEKYKDKVLLVRWFLIIASTVGFVTLLVWWTLVFVEQRSQRPAPLHSAGPVQVSKKEHLEKAEEFAIDLRIGHYKHRSTTWSRDQLRDICNKSSSLEKQAALSEKLAYFYTATLKLSREERQVLDDQISDHEEYARSQGYDSLCDLLHLLIDNSKVLRD